MILGNTARIRIGLTACAIGLLAAVAFSAAGCRPAPAVQPTPTVGAPQRTEQPTPGPQETVDPASEIARLARVELVERLGVDADRIEVVSVVPTEFPDASLGVPEPDQFYAQVITPGYIVELSVDDRTYTVHASGDRAVLVPEDDGGGPPTGRISVTGVETTAQRVTVRGTSALPQGACVSAELWADGVLQAWWPSDDCAPVTGGAWELVVPLDAGQALQPGVQYMVRAYQPGGPDIVGTFPFDLDGPQEPTGAITISTVDVTADQVRVRGTSALPQGACVSAELWADGVPQAWWPSDDCAPVTDGAWELVVPVDVQQMLRPDVQYMLRAYEPGGPNIVSAFPFDLSGPDPEP